MHAPADVEPDAVALEAAADAAKAAQQSSDAASGKSARTENGVLSLSASVANAMK